MGYRHGVELQPALHHLKLLRQSLETVDQKSDFGDAARLDLCASAEVARRHAPRRVGKFAERCCNAPGDEITKQAAQEDTEQSEEEHRFEKFAICLVLQAR
ncbi:hypothetical protein D3C87_1392460 [compost metagenome]